MLKRKRVRKTCKKLTFDMVPICRKETFIKYKNKYMEEIDRDLKKKNKFTFILRGKNLFALHFGPFGCCLNIFGGSGFQELPYKGVFGCILKFLSSVTVKIDEPIH